MSATAPVTTPVPTTRREVAAPLCVDLDGTLIKTDLLFELLILLIKRRPLDLFRVPGWLLKGRAYLKQRLAASVTLDVTCLPYREPLLTFLREQKAAGRSLTLATAADERVAGRIAEHLGIFGAVVASDGVTNCAGRHKLAALTEHHGGNRFVYVGDAAVDLPIWQQAEGAILVAGGARFEGQLTNVERTFTDATRPKEVLKAIRLHQWAKNVLLFVPLVLSHEVANLPLLGAALAAFVAFGLLASSVYVQNDLLDLEADRHHARKRFRPFAAGALPIRFGLLLAPLLIVLSVAIALFLPPAFIAVLGLYFVTTVSYSFYFKRKPILDVLLLSLLYTLRIVAGGAAIGVAVSPWLLAFSMFFFLNLAYVKRFSELRELPGESSLRARGYTRTDLEGLADLGVSSGYVSILVVALYINSPEVRTLYASPEALWLLCPLLVYWVSRVWLLARRGKMHDDPVVFALRDRVSYAIGAAALLVGGVAAIGLPV